MTYVLADTSLTEELEQLELTKGTETKHGMVEGRDLLDGDLAAGRSVDGRADDAVRALADDIEDLVVAADNKGGHAVVHGGWGGRVGGGRWGAMDKEGERREVQEVAQARSAA